ncbi:MAG: GTPase HflX [Candidatus Eisenbacteria bacterium]|nr:GTPase HflX [Candidatus Eisenbacteria bacterium]
MIRREGGPPDRARDPGHDPTRYQHSKESPITQEFERSKAGPTKGLLIGFAPQSDEDDTLNELELLADTAGLQTVGRLHQRRSSVHPGNFLSKGKLDEAKELLEAGEADLLLSDEDLSPAQVRNLEKFLKVRVIDRSELILDIFAQRARTREAQLQVELAQLHYLLPRLTGMWGHLSRTGGGIGTRGPGETQLEVDRRRVREKIALLEERLKKVVTERETQSRGRVQAFRVSFVGYTNAGKSTLFNRLTGADVLAEDKLFATLDTTTRRVHLGGELEVLLSDTVGFIRKLPHHLVASFRATLREVEEADLVVHVVDAAHVGFAGQIRAVEEVLESLLKEPVPRLLVLNKSDLFEDETRRMELQLRFPEGIQISAFSKDDLLRLKARLLEAIRELRTLARVECPIERLPEMRKLTPRAERRSEQHLDGRVWTELFCDRTELQRLRRAGFRVTVPRALLADRASASEAAAAMAAQTSSLLEALPQSANSDPQSAEG